MSDRPHLRELADRMGILPSYTEASSGEQRPTSDVTRVGLLAAMGLDAATEVAAAEALRTLAERERSRLVEPVVVCARDSSTRLPGKATLTLVGKTMLQHVVERYQSCDRVDKVIVAAPRGEGHIKELCEHLSYPCHLGPLPR